MSDVPATVRLTVSEAKEAADLAELEAVRAVNALFGITDERVAADVKAKVLAAFRANADFFNACSREAGR